MVDVLVAGIALAFIGPVMLLLAAAVRLTSRGPAFYRQVRVGRSGEHFAIMKLRSMVSGADRAGPLVTSRRGLPRHHDRRRAAGDQAG